MSNQLPDHVRASPSVSVPFTGPRITQPPPDRAAHSQSLLLPSQAEDCPILLPLNRYTVTTSALGGGSIKTEKFNMLFDHDLLRLTFIKPKSNSPFFHIDLLAIRDFEIQETPRVDHNQNDPVEYPHLRENECECFGGPAYQIKLPPGEKLAELRHGYTFDLTILYLSGAPAHLERLRRWIEEEVKRERNFATVVCLNRFLKRAHYDHTAGKRSGINFKDFKSIVGDYLNINLPDKFKDWFSSYSSRFKDSMSLEQLQDFLKDFLFDPKSLSTIFEGYNFQYSKRELSIHDFDTFFRDSQGEEFSGNRRAHILGNRISGRVASSTEKHVSLIEFYHWMFSRENDIADRKKADPLKYPLNYYWINSSHNTYLMGNQYRGLSSIEAYIRALLQGCRCLELDCLDGSNKDPMIGHKGTLCNKIRLFDVLKAINRYAFKKSPYPVILSIENHLCIEQQVVMASMMKNVFKKKLIVDDLFPGDPRLPSPENLQYKIIIKNKKIQDNESEEVDEIDEVDENDEENENEDYYSSIEEMGATLSKGDPGIDEVKLKTKDVKKFTVFINDSLDGKVFSYGQIAIQGNYLYVKEERPPPARCTELSELLCYSWYHGPIPRRMADQVIVEFIRTRYIIRGLDQAQGSGAFLVRRSGSAPNYSFAVSVWGDNSVKHMRIKSETNAHGLIEYFIDRSSESNPRFLDIAKLVSFYNRRKLENSKYFRYPVPNPDHYMKKLWYKGAMERADAVHVLNLGIRSPGKFLVRDRCDKNTGARVGFTISYLDRGLRDQHITAMEVGPHLRISDQLIFWSLNEMIHHFTTVPLPVGAHDVFLNVSDICPDLKAARMFGAMEYLTIELKENHPYTHSDPPMILIEGLKFHKAVRTMVDGEEVYEGQLGAQKGYRIPVRLAEPVPEDTPFGDNAKCKMFISPQVLRVITREEDKREICQFVTPISRVTIRFINPDQMRQFQELFSKAANVEQASMVTGRLSKELSDLVVYCQATKVPKPFIPCKINDMKPYDMCSFTELTIDKWAKTATDYQNLCYFSVNQIARMYPSWKRMDSFNYQPVMPWSYGIQMVALNFQMSDLPMQLNHGMFTRNRKFGYVLKPPFQSKDDYDPNDSSTYVYDSNPISLTIRLWSGRLISLAKGWNRAGFYVVVTKHGVGKSATEQQRSTVDRTGGISPKWYKDVEANTFRFEVNYPQLEMIQFELRSANGDVHAQRCVPVDYIRKGYRSVLLHNAFSEEHELACLLVHVGIEPAIPAHQSCSFGEMNILKDSQLQKKASDLANEIHCSVKYRQSSEAELKSQQETLEGYLAEMYKLKAKFFDAFENPMAMNPDMFNFNQGPR